MWKRSGPHHAAPILFYWEAETSTGLIKPRGEKSIISPVGFATVSDRFHYDLPRIVMTFVDNSVVSDPDSILQFLASHLSIAVRSRIIFQVIQRLP